MASGDKQVKVRKQLNPKKENIKTQAAITKKEDEEKLIKLKKK